MRKPISVSRGYEPYKTGIPILMVKRQIVALESGRYHVSDREPSVVRYLQEIKRQVRLHPPLAIG